jgi:hypothetical protein
MRSARFMTDSTVDREAGRGVLLNSFSRSSSDRELVNEQMLAMLEWASDHPNRWHNIGKLEATQRAAELLATRGVIEVRQPQNQYRLKPAPK